MNETLTIHQQNYRHLAKQAEDERLEKTFLLQARFYGLPELKRNYRFDEPDSRMEFDFAHLPSRVACEIQGGIWGQSRSGHSTAKGITRDINKNNSAQMKGWLLILLTPEMATNGLGALLVKRAIELRGSSAS